MTLFAATPLFETATQSNWNVTQGSKSIGRITLLTSKNGSRADFYSSSSGKTTLFGGQDKVWLHAGSEDTDLATISATTPESTTAAALLLPYTTTRDDAVESKDGKVTSYAYRGAKAKYTYDSKGPSKIEITESGKKYALTRTSLSSSSAGADEFKIRPAGGRGSRLAKLSGNLLGASDTSVSATAGIKGATPGSRGMKLSDGGDYAAVEKLEDRDDTWGKKLDADLTQFQKSGKVGKVRENQ